MQIHLIWAQDQNGGIGKNGNLPWHISEDLKNFKKITFGSTIVMGRKTWDSLPIKPLPKRRNIILSSKTAINIEYYNSIEKCIKILSNEHIKKLYVIGGSSIYDGFFKYADELHITQINNIYEGIDTYFPISMSEIYKNYTKANEVYLSDIAIYSNWTRN